MRPFASFLRLANFLLLVLLLPELRRRGRLPNNLRAEQRQQLLRKAGRRFSTSDTPRWLRPRRSVYKSAPLCASW